MELAWLTFVKLGETHGIEVLENFNSLYKKRRLMDVVVGQLNNSIKKH
jgi:hypothetical protein